jgi:hypothetical protein
MYEEISDQRERGEGKFSVTYPTVEVVVIDIVGVVGR